MRYKLTYEAKSVRILEGSKQFGNFRSSLPVCFSAKPYIRVQGHDILRFFRTHHLLQLFPEDVFCRRVCCTYTWYFVQQGLIVNELLTVGMQRIFEGVAVLQNRKRNVIKLQGSIIGLCVIDNRPCVLCVKIIFFSYLLYERVTCCYAPELSCTLLCHTENIFCKSSK